LGRKSRALAGRQVNTKFFEGILKREV